MHLTTYSEKRLRLSVCHSFATKFTHRAWIRAQPEAFLFSKSFLSLPPPGGLLRCGRDEHWPCLNATQCDEYTGRALEALQPFDHVAFVEEPESFRPILRLAHLPYDGTGPKPTDQLAHTNLACKYCHSGAMNDTTRGVNENVTLTSGNESISLRDVRELATRANACSLRAYEAIKAHRMQHSRVHSRLKELDLT